MKTLKMLVSMIAGSTSVAFAANGSQSADSGVLVYFFIGFFALIIVSQLIPAVILFFGMVKGIFTRPEKVDAKNN